MISKKVVLVSLFLTLLGCSSTDKEIRHDLRGLSDHQYSREEMIDHMRDVIDRNPNLTEKQKSDFLDLHVNVMQEVSTVNQNVRKLKILLFQEMSKENYSQRRLDSLVSRVKKQHELKLQVMLRAFKEAKEILGIHFREIDYERYHIPFIAQ